MNPIYQERLENIEFYTIGNDILRSARNELYLNMRFLDLALSSLAFFPDPSIRKIGSDGQTLFFHPEDIIRVFREGRQSLNHLYLHSIMHCLFSHLWDQKDRESELWDLACDIAVEHVIDHLNIRAVRIAPSALRRECYHSLKELGTLTAQKIYRKLQELDYSPSQLEILKRDFTLDDHSKWSRESKNQEKNPIRQKWDDIRDKMQTEMETFSKEASDDAASLEEQIAAVNRKRYDYRDFLRKFSVLKEEVQVDMDSFDYMYYHFGLEMYGNIPLIEPLETREVRKIEEFVIVVDTSMSCQGELILRFLDETWSVLSENDSFFRKIHVHILQCDDKVQEDVLITSREEMEDYLNHFTVKGFGGTDFRPPFLRVSELMMQKCFKNLRGLIYFTDGYGTFPVKKHPMKQLLFL